MIIFRLKSCSKFCSQLFPKGRYDYLFYNIINLNLKAMYVKLNDRIAWERAECESTCGTMDIVSDAGFFSCYWPGFNPAHPDVMWGRDTVEITLKVLLLEGWCQYKKAFKTACIFYKWFISIQERGPDIQNTSVDF